MTAIGVFRDDFYNATCALPQAAIATTTQSGGVLSASIMVGGGDQYVLFSGQTTAQSITTDTAVNIITQLQNTVAVALKTAIAGSGAGVSPANGITNLFNVAYTLTLVNNNTASGAITLTGGTGVTIVGGTTLAITTDTTYVVAITSPTTVTITAVLPGVPV